MPALALPKANVHFSSKTQQPLVSIFKRFGQLQRTCARLCPAACSHAARLRRMQRRLMHACFAVFELHGGVTLRGAGWCHGSAFMRCGAIGMREEADNRGVVCMS